MKQSAQIAILAAVGLGAFFMLRSANGAQRAGSIYYPTTTQQNAPMQGTPAYNQWLADQRQAQLDNQKLGLLYTLGKSVNGIFSGSGSSANSGGGINPIDSTWTGQGYNLGSTGIFGDWTASSDGRAGEAAAQQYVINNPDAFAVNPPTITNDMTLRAIMEGNSEY